MDNRKYEAFLRISETGSITKAADIMGYTQSGLTQMMKNLEAELGLTLLTRTNRGVFLTNAGKRLLPFIREEQRAEEQIRQECAAIAGKHGGRLTVGCLASVSESWMPAVLERLAKQYPDMKVSMEELESPAIREMLAEGRLDIGICEIEEETVFHSTPLLEDDIFAIVPPEHPLTRQDSVTIRELAAYPFISFAIGETSLDAPGWPEMMLKQAVRLNIVYTCKDNLTVLNMIRHHLGVTVSSSLIMSNYESDVVSLPFDPPIVRTIGLLSRRDEKMLPAAQTFIQCLREYVHEKHTAQDLSTEYTTV